MSTYPFKAVSKTRRSEGKVVVGIAIDDYFEQHVCGYKVDGIARVMRGKQFNERYKMIKDNPLTEGETKKAFALLKSAYEPQDEQATANVLDRVAFRKPLQVSGMATQNKRGEWVPPIPLPYYLAFGRVRCSCGEKFWNEEAYNAHYAYKHILFPDV